MDSELLNCGSLTSMTRNKFSNSQYSSLDGQSSEATDAGTASHQIEHILHTAGTIPVRSMLPPPQHTYPPRFFQRTTARPRPSSIGASSGHGRPHLNPTTAHGVPCTSPIDHIPAPHVLEAFILTPVLSDTTVLHVAQSHSHSFSALSGAPGGLNSRSMNLRSLALVWAALLGGVNAVFQKYTFGPSSPQVQLVPSSAWSNFDTEDKPYAYTDVEGAQIIFTFPRACRLGQHASITPRHAHANSNHV